jgi:hypothetical protein
MASLAVRPSLPVYLDIADLDVEHRHICFLPEHRSDMRCYERSPPLAEQSQGMTGDVK